MKHARPGRKPLVVAAAIVVATAVGVTLTMLPRQTAQASGTQVYTGKGWQISANFNHINALSDDGTGYVIEYADHHLQVGVEKAAAQIQSVTGMAFKTKFVATMPEQNCSTWPRHVLELGSKWRPDGRVGYSHSWPCYAVADHTAWGGWGFIDSEYWKAPNLISHDPAITEANTQNVITHEIGHLIGLDHPNKDLNGDGVVGDRECEKTANGYLPLMCALGGGYLDTHGEAQFTSLEIPALKQLVDNYRLPTRTGVAPNSVKRGTSASDGAAAGVR